MTHMLPLQISGQMASSFLASGPFPGNGRLMRAHLSAVQAALVGVLAASLLALVVCWPDPDNRRFLAATHEISAFRAVFERSAAERTLRRSVERRGLTSLAAVQAAAQRARGPKLELPANAKPIRPLTSIHLATLADVYALAQPGSSTRIGRPDVRSLGTALAWRLAELGPEGPVTLRAVELVPADVGEKDVALEGEMAQLARERVQAQAQVERASRRLESRDRMLEIRRKRRLPWKVVKKAIDARQEAQVELDDKTRGLADAEAIYQSRRAEAQRARAERPDLGVSEFALARVVLELGGSQKTLDIPVRLQLAQVPVPSLRKGRFAATRAAGLWDEVKGLDAEAALAHLRGRFNWHNHHVEVAGLKWGGMTVLQLLPWLLSGLLFWSWKRVREALSSYSPFTPEQHQSLPRVGLGSRALEFTALLVLPLGACVSAAVALGMIGQVPVLPAAAAVINLTLGGAAFSKLGELRGLVASVVHAQSYPPAG